MRSKGEERGYHNSCEQRFLLGHSAPDVYLDFWAIENTLPLSHSEVKSEAWLRKRRGKAQRALFSIASDASSSILKRTAHLRPTTLPCRADPGAGSKPPCPAFLRLRL